MLEFRCGLVGVVSVLLAEVVLQLGVRSIRRTPSQLHSLQQIPKQQEILPQQLVYKNELNR